MAKLARRQTPALFPDVFDWLDTPWSALLPFTPSQTFRVEDFVEGDTYVVRAELPGLDPEKDIEVEVTDGALTIRAERREEHEEPHRSEFRYGSLTRSVALPDRCDTDNIKATYDQGILRVEAPVAAAKPEGRKIAVRTTG